jgi:hypothetical protein
MLDPVADKIYRTLAPEVQRNILGENAAKFYGLRHGGRESRCIYGVSAVRLRLVGACAPLGASAFPFRHSGVAATSPTRYADFPNELPTRRLHVTQRSRVDCYRAKQAGSGPVRPGAGYRTT